MDKEFLKLIEKQGLKLIGKEDRFNFRCTCCGSCCRNREDILLNIQDVLNIHTYLNISFQTLIEQYCEMYIGYNSKLPVIRLKPQGKNKICPFLYKGKCKINEIKPFVCAIFPLARITDINTKDHTKEFYYAIQPITCGAKDKSNSVKEWIGKYDSPEYFEIARKWNEFLGIISSWVHGLNFEPSRHFYTVIAQFMYENYDRDDNIAEQINIRMHYLSKIIEKSNEI